MEITWASPENSVAQLFSELTKYEREKNPSMV